MALALLRAWRTTSAGTKQGAAEGLGAGRTETEAGEEAAGCGRTMEAGGVGCPDGVTGTVERGGFEGCARREMGVVREERERGSGAGGCGEEVVARGGSGGAKARSRRAERRREEKERNLAGGAARARRRQWWEVRRR